MQGRTLLSFSDNRQDAAFFAPYFERTSGDLALRSAIYQLLKGAEEPMDLEVLGEQVYKFWRRTGQPVMIDARGDLRNTWIGMRDSLLGKIAAEFCTPGGRRNSLKALGMVGVDYETGRLKRLLRQVVDLIPERHRDQAKPLVRFLLETMRREKALGNLYDLPMEDPFLWGATYARRRAFEEFKANDKISHAWLPQEGSALSPSHGPISSTIAIITRYRSRCCVPCAV